MYSTEQVSVGVYGQLLHFLLVTLRVDLTPSSGKKYRLVCYRTQIQETRVLRPVKNSCFIASYLLNTENEMVLIPPQRDFLDTTKMFRKSLVQVFRGK